MKILAVTNHPSGTSVVHLSDTNLAALIPVYSEVHEYSRVHINPFASNRLMAAGDGRATYSHDGGLTWLQSTYVGSGGPPAFGVATRRVQWVGVNDVFITANDGVFFSGNGGATFALVSAFGVSNTIFMDTLFTGVLTGYAITVDIFGAGSNFLETVNGGVSWTVRTTMDGSFTGWVPEEIGLRIEVGGGISEVFVLSTHRLYSVLNPSGPGLISSSVRWNIDQALAASIWSGSIGTNGYAGPGAIPFDNKWFDDIRSGGTAHSRLWLGGKAMLRAHSFDQVVFNFTNPAEINFATFNDFYTHTPLNINTVFSGNSRITGAPAGTFPGLSQSSNGGITSVAFYQFGSNESLKHHDVFDAFTDSGCSLTTACNYKEGVIYDNGSCQTAVTLTDCASTDQLTTMSPDLVALSCRNPRVALNIPQLDPNSSAQVIYLTINGAQTITYNAYVANTLPAVQRTLEFVQGFIAHINANVDGLANPFRASWIPPSLNTLSPNSLTGIWLEQTFVIQGSTFSAAALGVLGTTFETVFDTGSTGAVVRLVEFPDRCWRICGPGACDQAQDYTLLSAHSDCLRCLPLPIGTVCQPCENMVSIAGVPLVDGPTVASAQCVAAGEQIDFNLSIAFPEFVSNNYAVASSVCTPGCGMSITIADDVTPYFPSGSTTTVNGDGGYYTVIDSVYDVGSNSTLVTFAEPCVEVNPINSIDSFTNCQCQVSVSFDNVDLNDNIDNWLYFCQNGMVEQVFSSTVPAYGTYVITVVATSCGNDRICKFWLKACDSYQVYNAGCHTWQVELMRPSGSPTTAAGDHQVVITDSENGAVLLSTTVVDTGFPIQFITPSDGVYHIRIVSPNSDIWEKDIIDVCDLLACRKKITLSLLCKDDFCDTAISDAEMAQRQELSRINILLAELDREVYLDRYRFTGLPTYSSEQIKDTKRIATLINQIKTIALRCGVCQSTIDQIDATCSNCD